MSDYADYQVQISPTALQGSYGSAHQRAYGIIKDYYAALSKDAVQLRFPGIAPPDALGSIGSDRLIEQGIDTLTGANESQAAYITRVKRAWPHDGIRGHAPDTANATWYWGGTAFGMLRAFDVLGYDPTIVQQNGTYWSLSGGNLVIVQNPPLTGWPVWNSFLVLFPSAPASWTSMDVPATGVSVPNLDEINRLIRLINLWKPAHALCLGIQVNVSGRFWGYPPVGAGGAPVWGTGTWGGSAFRWPVPAGPPVNL
jgi:hypothetical protein